MPASTLWIVFGSWLLLLLLTLASYVFQGHRDDAEVE